MNRACIPPVVPSRTCLLSVLPQSSRSRTSLDHILPEKGLLGRLSFEQRNTVCPELSQAIHRFVIDEFVQSGRKSTTSDRSQLERTTQDLNRETTRVLYMRPWRTRRSGQCFRLECEEPSVRSTQCSTLSVLSDQHPILFVVLPTKDACGESLWLPPPKLPWRPSIWTLRTGRASLFERETVPCVSH